MHESSGVCQRKFRDQLKGYVEAGPLEREFGRLVYSRPIAYDELENLTQCVAKGRGFDGLSYRL